MSRARREKKRLRTFEYTDKYGEIAGYCIGYTEAEFRIERRMDKLFGTGYGYLEPALGVKYHIPRRCYWPYKGRRQLPRDYYKRNRNRLKR